MAVELRIRIDGEGRVLGTTIPTTIRSLAAGTSREVLVRVGKSPTSVFLDPGRYLVEASLPSGELLRGPAELRDGAPPLDLYLKPSRSPHEWLSLQHLLVSPARLQPPLPRLILEALGPYADPRMNSSWKGLKEHPTVSLLPEGGAQVTAKLASNPSQLHSEQERPLYPMFGDGTVDCYEVRPWAPDPKVTGTIVIRQDAEQVLIPVSGWRSVDGTEVSTELVVNATNRSVSTTVADPVFAPLLAYLAAGQSAKAAHTLGDMPLDFLYAKLRNPFAAAAGAYVLVQSRRSETSESQPRWRSWIHNLAERFPMLPDGAILEGWMRLHQEDQGSGIENSRALEMFLQAFHRGVPHFTAGLRMLLDGLLFFDEASLSGMQLDTFRDALRTVRQWATWVDPSEPFTTLHVPLENRQ
jgi:hypothetical protein